MSTLLEKFTAEGFDPVFHANGVGDPDSYDENNYLMWPTFWFYGDFDLNAVTGAYIQHLEDIGTPWETRTERILGVDVPMSLAVRVSVIRPDSHMVHIYPANGLKDLG